LTTKALRFVDYQVSVHQRGAGGLHVAGQPGWTMGAAHGFCSVDEVEDYQVCADLRLCAIAALSLKPCRA
jgi:hypothetical protein